MTLAYISPRAFAGQQKRYCAPAEVPQPDRLKPPPKTPYCRPSDTAMATAIAR
jgi:hypothetical protein